MSGRIQVSSFDFAAFSFVIDHVRCVLRRSFLVGAVDKGEEVYCTISVGAAGSSDMPSIRTMSGRFMNCSDA